jgi:hypothetical protein
MLYVGRLLSTFFDTLTIFFIYKISENVFKKKYLALLGAFFYCIAFFPIQNSHFFVVDVFLTFFITAIFYSVLRYHAYTSFKAILSISLFAGCALATKFTSILFLPLVIFYLALRNGFSQKTLIHGLGFIIFSFAFFFVCMPYGILDFKSFFHDVQLQTTMSRDAYIFPYTLQYVGTLPYIYYVKNIFLWGIGPFISIFTFAGFLYYISFFKKVIKGSIKDRVLYMLPLCFYGFYFLILGFSQVKFMRYMLPIYPFLCLFAGYGFYMLFSEKGIYKILSGVFLVLSLLWTASFLRIYLVPQTRIAADDWIHTTIPQGSKILVEHWDDRLPLKNSENYIISELTLYDIPDDHIKWSILNQKLKESDYLIIASNRLYIPLQKLSDCSQYKKCYPLTAQYYQTLFSGKLGYKKVAEFSSYPGISFGSFVFTIPDDLADESFTVYDHPKIMIYQREK